MDKIAESIFSDEISFSEKNSISICLNSTIETKKRL